MPVFTARAYVTMPLFLGIKTEIKPCPQRCPQDVVPLFLIDRELRYSPLPHSLTLDGAADNLYWIGNWRFGGCINRLLYVLVSVSKEDWVGKESPFFPIDIGDLAELHTQNRFHAHDPDELQHQLRSSDVVRS